MSALTSMPASMKPSRVILPSEGDCTSSEKTRAKSDLYISKRNSNAIPVAGQHSMNESPTNRASCSRYDDLPRIAKGMIHKGFLPPISSRPMPISLRRLPVPSTLISSGSSRGVSRYLSKILFMLVRIGLLALLDGFEKNL